MKQKNAVRNAGLDLLRLLAVLLVLGRHLHLPSNPHLFLDTWQRGGWVGVDLFFVLSGYLVSGLLFDDFIKSGRIDTKRFLIRRAWKIYPPFWVLIAFTLTMRFYLNYGDDFVELTRKTFAEVFFVQNYAPGLFTHTWTLGVEEHFYLLVAILLPALASQCQPFRAIPYVFALIAISCFMLRWWTEYDRHDLPFDWIKQVAATHLRLDSLLFGTLLAYLCRFHQLEAHIRKIPSAALVAVGASLMAPAFCFPIENTPWMRIGGVVAFYLASGLWLLAAIRIEASTAPPVRWLAALGAASYSIYLWHNAVEVWGTRTVVRITGSDAFPLYIGTYILGSLVVGYVMARLVEGPILALRDRLMPISRAA